MPGLFFLRKKRVLLVLIILLPLLIWGGSNFLSSRNKQTASTVVKRGDIKETLTLSGKIDADEHVTLQFQVGGLLTWVGVKEGDYVQKYQGIASLDQRQLQKTLTKKLNDYMTTRWNFEQTKDDNKDRVVTDAIKRVLEKSQFSLDNSVLDVELQSLSVEFANLSTPISGVVTRVDTPFAGVNIYTPNLAQFEIVNPDTVFFNVNADQTEVTKLKLGQKTSIVLDSYLDRQFEGEIKNIAYTPKEGETETVYAVKILLRDLSNKDLIFRLGMTGDAEFTVAEEKDVLSIPSQFIKSDDKGKYVFLGNGKKKTYIEIGLETDTETEVKSGLGVGDIVYD